MVPHVSDLSQPPRPFRRIAARAGEMFMSVRHLLILTGLTLTLACGRIPAEEVKPQLLPIEVLQFADATETRDLIDKKGRDLDEKEPRNVIGSSDLPDRPNVPQGFSVAVLNHAMDDR